METKNYQPGWTITVSAGKDAPYEICLEESFASLCSCLSRIGCSGHRICIVTDSNVAPLYLETIRETVQKACSEVCTFLFPAGEASKTLDTVRMLYEKLIQEGFDRHDFLLALGGGVVGDLTGFASATYLRGISFIQVPTTLLAQIDSSIGGKTGVDFDSYKNMVGAFHQPALVYINTKTLLSLPEEQFACGMAELLKHGLIEDLSYYDWTISHREEIRSRDAATLLSMVGRSCEIKRAVVQRDPNETTGERALLNFGHTIGHAIEKLTNFDLLHGQCVALGTLAAAYISRQRGLIGEEDLEKIRKTNLEFGLPVSFSGPSAAEIIAATKKDKKMEAGLIRFVLLEQPGKAVVVSDVTDQEMEDALRYLRTA